jgi:hypothetical protein
MNLTGKRLAALAATVAALAATVSTLAIGIPAAGASAALPATLPGLPSLSVPGLPALALPPLSFSDPSARVSSVVGPTITDSIVSEGPGAAGQVAAAAPQSISLLSTTAGPTIANGIP